MIAFIDLVIYKTEFRLQLSQKRNKSNDRYAYPAYRKGNFISKNIHNNTTQNESLTLIIKCYKFCLLQHNSFFRYNIFIREGNKRLEFYKHKLSDTGYQSKHAIFP